MDILIKTARKLQTLDSLPHKFVAAKTDGWSSAELAAIWTEASLLAVADDRKEVPGRLTNTPRGGEFR